MKFPDNILYHYVKQYTHQIFNYILVCNSSIISVITDNCNNSKLLSFSFIDNKKQIEYESGVLHFNTSNIDENILEVEYVRENIVALHTALKYQRYAVVFTIEIDKEFISKFIHNQEIKNAINEEYRLFLASRVLSANALYVNKILSLGGMPKDNMISNDDIVLI